MPLPGSQKYAPDEQHEAKPWEDELVVRANEEVPITSVLSEYFNVPVPEQAYGWKTYCVQKWEHKDGGIDRQFRVYTDTNSAWCFAVHGFYTPVRLWRLRSGAATLKDAARELLRVYGIRIKEPTYQEQFEMIRQEASRKAVATTDSMLEALQVFLETVPGYTLRQFDVEVLRVVNLTIEEIQVFCAQNPSLEEARPWLRSKQEWLRGQISP